MNGEGYRLRMQKLRGVFSEGLIMNLSEFPELTDLPIGTDVSDILGIKQWTVLETLSDFGSVKKGYVPGIPKSDELRVQSFPHLLGQMNGQPAVITEKIDGTSLTFSNLTGKPKLYLRNSEVIRSAKSSLWQWFENNSKFQSLLNSEEKIVIQGELAGPKIQKNTKKLTELTWFVFRSFDEKGNQYDMDDTRRFCASHQLIHVPILEEINYFDYDLEQLQKILRNYAKAQHEPNGLKVEGLVVESLGGIQKKFNVEYGNARLLSFKVINNDFTLDEE